MNLGFRIIIKPGLFEWKKTGKSQPGLDLERAIVDFLIAKNLATNSKGDCCSLELNMTSTTRGFQPPRLTAAQVTAWQNSFNTTTHVTGIEDASTSRQGELVFNLTTGKFVGAVWNGSAWTFSNLN